MSGIAILGAGAFGTALAAALAADGTPVSLWGRDGRAMADLGRTRRNRRHLADAVLPPSVAVTGRIEDVPEGTVLLAIPAQKLGPFLAAHGAHLSDRRLVACCKGIDLATGLGPTGVIAHHCPEAVAAVLTGPSFAADIAAGLPTALTLACADTHVGEEMQQLLSRGPLRLYLGSDVKGAELGGAVKNVIAIAAGVVMGAGFGASSRAALIARGFAEMQRLAPAFGADPATLSGLSGLGDLVLTCTSEGSRNYRAGLSIGQGTPPPDGVTVEGMATARALSGICAERKIDAPLISMVAALVEGEVSVQDARDALLSRPLKTE